MRIQALPTVNRSPLVFLPRVQAAAEIFLAVRRNQVLKRLDLSGNKIGPEVVDSLSEMVRQPRALETRNAKTPDHSSRDATGWIRTWYREPRVASSRSSCLLHRELIAVLSKPPVLREIQS